MTAPPLEPAGAAGIAAEELTNLEKEASAIIGLASVLDADALADTFAKSELSCALLLLTTKIEDEKRDLDTLADLPENQDSLRRIDAALESYRIVLDKIQSALRRAS